MATGTRIGFPGTIAGGAVTSSDNNDLPGGVIGYASITANQTGITTLTTITGLAPGAVTVGSNRFIGVHVHGIVGANADHAYFQVGIYDAGSLVQRKNLVGSGVSSPDSARRTNIDLWFYVNNPSSGSHTYTVKLGNAGSDTSTLNWVADIGTANDAVSFITVWDLGPKF